MRVIIINWRRFTLKFRGLYFGVLIRLMGGECGSGLLVDKGILFKYPPHSGIRIGKNVSFGKNITIDVPESGTMILGDSVKLNMDIVIAASKLVTIGRSSMIGEYSSVRDSDHGMDSSGLDMQFQPIESSPISIGNDVWIARGVAVLKGADIGNGAVVGANSVVKGSVPPMSIAAGVPAAVRRKR